MACSGTNQRSEQIQVPAGSLCPLPAPDPQPPSAGKRVFFLPTLKHTQSPGREVGLALRGVAASGASHASSCLPGFQLQDPGQEVF